MQNAWRVGREWYWCVSLKAAPGGRLNRESSDRHTGLMWVRYPRESMRKRTQALKERENSPKLVKIWSEKLESMIQRP